METNSETDITRQIMALYTSYKIKDNLELVYVDMYIQIPILMMMLVPISLQDLTIMLKVGLF